MRQAYAALPAGVLLLTHRVCAICACHVSRELDKLDRLFAGLTVLTRVEW